jgi:hypothetical protein
MNDPLICNHFQTHHGVLRQKPPSVVEARPTASQLEVCAVGEVFLFLLAPSSNKEFYDTFSVEVGLFDLTVKNGNALQAMPCYFTV